MKQVKLKYLTILNPSINLKLYDSEMLVSFAPMECIKLGYMSPKEALIKNYNSSYNIFLNDDIVVAKVTPCFENGNIAIASNLLNGIGFGSSEIFVLRANKCNTKYLFYILQEEAFRQMAISTMTGAGGLKRISSDIIRNYPVPNITFKTQQRIADYLDRKTSAIDGLIADKQKMIDLLKEKRQAIISETVTKGLDKNAKMKHSGIPWIGEIPKEWEVSRFRYCFTTRTGLTITRAELLENGVPCINYGEIHSKYSFDLDLNRDNLKYAPMELLDTKRSSLVNENDFIFCDTSEDMEGSGNNVYIKNQCEQHLFAGSHTVIAHPIKQFNSRYLAYLFCTDDWRSQIRSCVYGVKVFSITQTLLKTTKLLFPPLQTQQAIVDYLDHKTSQIDTLINDITEQIDKLKEYRGAIISEVVTGKVEV